MTRSGFDLEQLRADVFAGRMTRRGVLQRAMVLGLSAPVVAGLLAACGDDDDDSGDDTSEPTAAGGAGADATESTDDDAEPTEAAGDEGSEDEPTETADDEGDDGEATEPAAEAGERGGSGLLRLFYWQAPVILNPHLANGTKDFHASRVCLEPLADWDANLEPILVLASEWPSVENGTLAEDLTSVTWKLREGVTWHDGEEFNAEDVVFTYEYISNPDNACTTIGRYQTVESVEAIDDYTVQINFTVPTPAWYDPFVTSEGIILPQHIFADFQGEESRNAPANLEPIGTGPFKVREFRPGDVVLYDLNENYWDPGKPHIDEVEMKGGGDSLGAARAVLQTGEADWAWNLQIEPAVLAELEGGGIGELDALPGGGTERLMINFTDPNTEVDGQRSHISVPHPVFSDVRARQALALACQRDVIAEQLYGPGGVAASNQYDEPAKFTNPDLTWTYDLDEAQALLDEMGFEGANVLYQTSINSVRQKTQEIIKQSMEQLGFTVELKSIDAAVYFSTDQGNPDTSGKFYADLEMHTNGPTPYPASWFDRYRSDEIAQQENGWSGTNYFRYANPEFDELHDQFRVEVDEDRQIEIAQAMLELVTATDVVEVPLVNRTNLAAKATRIQGYTGSQWASNPIHDLKNWTLDPM
jgi:peptide/nickel transport system substrate-binding protein